MKATKAYDILREVQIELHGEYVMSANLDEDFNQKEKDRLDLKLFPQMIEEKKYYLRLFCLKHFSKTTSNPLIDPKVLYLNTDIDQFISKFEYYVSQSFSIYPDEQHNINFIETIFQLKEKDALNAEVTDFLSFCVIPSFYLMFLEGKAVQNFCNFIRKIRDDKRSENMHYLLSRSLFISPMFIKFLRQTLYRFFRPIYNDNCTTKYSDSFDNNIAELQTEILMSFRENISIVPSYIKTFLSSMNDTKGFLNECLFKPLFENPEQFLIIDACVTDFEDKMNLLKNLLESIFTEEIIDEIVNIFDACDECEKSNLNFNPSERRIMQKFRKVVNSVDILVFDQIDDIVEGRGRHQVDMFGKVKFDNYLYYRSVFEAEKEEEHKRIYSDTIASMNDCWMQLRKLLKESEPLPSRYDIPDEIIDDNMFVEMLKELLVDSGDPYNVIAAEISFRNFVKLFNPKEKKVLESEEYFREKMKNLVIIHKEQAAALEKIKTNEEEFTKIYWKKYEFFGLMETLLNTKLTYLLNSPEDLKRIPKRSIDILSNPNFYKDYIAYRDEQPSAQSKKALELYGNECKQIIFKRYFAPIRFNQFVAFRTDLNKFDEIMSDACKQYVLNFHSEMKLCDSEEIKKAAQCLNLFTKQVIQLKEAFASNYDPYTKLLRFEKTFFAIQGVFKKEFITGEFGEHEKNWIQMIVTAFANPPRFVSNMVYLLEFVKDFNGAEKYVNTTCLVSIYSDLLNYTKFSAYLDYPLTSLSRSHRFPMQCYITGNDAAAIVDVYRHFLNFAESKKKMSEEEEERMIEKIERNPDSNIPFVFKITKYGEACFLIDGIIGQNIRYKQDDVMKLAFFAYKQKETGFTLLHRDEKTKFVSNNAIPNENKFIVYDGEDELSIKQKDIKIVDLEKLNLTLIKYFISLIEK